MNLIIEKFFKEKMSIHLKMEKIDILGKINEEIYKKFGYENLNKKQKIFVHSENRLFPKDSRKTNESNEFKVIEEEISSKNIEISNFDGKNKSSISKKLNKIMNTRNLNKTSIKSLSITKETDTSSLLLTKCKEIK